jgi:hypothetical protein
MRERQRLFFGLPLVNRIFEEFQHPAIQALWRIFSANKSAPANRKKGFYTNRDLNKQKVGLNFV